MEAACMHRPMFLTPLRRSRGSHLARHRVDGRGGQAGRETAPLAARKLGPARPQLSSGCGGGRRGDVSNCRQSWPNTWRLRRARHPPITLSKSIRQAAGAERNVIELHVRSSGGLHKLLQALVVTIRTPRRVPGSALGVGQDAD